MSDKTVTTKDRLRKLYGDIKSRANGFAGQQGLFSGALVGEELEHWAQAISEIYDEQD